MELKHYEIILIIKNDPIRESIRCDYEATLENVIKQANALLQQLDNVERVEVVEVTTTYNTLTEFSK